MFNRILQQHQCLKGEYVITAVQKKDTSFICLVFEVTQVQRFGQSPKRFSSLTFMQWLLQGPAWVWLRFLTAGQTVLLKHAWKWAYGIIHSNICTHPTLRPLSVSSYPKTLVRCDTCHTHATPIQHIESENWDEPFLLKVNFKHIINLHSVELPHHIIPRNWM